MKKNIVAILMLSLTLTLSTSALAKKVYHMEVVESVGDVAAIFEGTNRNLSKGDLLTTNEYILTGEASRVIVALDQDWNNVIHIDANSKVITTSLYPTGFYMNFGSMLAKLDALPTESTFEVQTPSLVVGARGTILDIAHDKKTKVAIVGVLEGIGYVNNFTAQRLLSKNAFEKVATDQIIISDLYAPLPKPRSMTENEKQTRLKKIKSLTELQTSEHTRNLNLAHIVNGQLVDLPEKSPFEGPNTTPNVNSIEHTQNDFTITDNTVTNSSSLRGGPSTNYEQNSDLGDGNLGDSVASVDDDVFANDDGTLGSDIADGDLIDSGDGNVAINDGNNLDDDNDANLVTTGDDFGTDDTLDSTSTSFDSFGVTDDDLTTAVPSDSADEVTNIDTTGGDESLAGNSTADCDLSDCSDSGGTISSP